MKIPRWEMRTDEILTLDIKLRQQELTYSMLQKQLEYLEEKYPKEFAEAWIHAYDVNLDKITALKSQIDNLEKWKHDTKLQQEDNPSNEL